MSLGFDVTFASVDALLREGRDREAMSHLRQLARGNPAREIRPAISQLARRAGAPEIGLRLLTSLVKPDGVRNPHAHPKEVAEYAASLIRLGALNEAESLLEELDETERPRACFLRALIHIARWDYADAARELRDFLALAELPTYERHVATVNLAAALVVEERTSEVDALLPIAIRETARAQHLLLHANLLEIAAQHEIARGNWQAASHHLATGESLVGDSDSLYAFFFRKWRLVLSLNERGSRADLLAALETLKAEARRRQHWESVRDLDYHLARATRDETRLLHLIFGTPYPALRARYARAWSEMTEGAPIPERHARSLGAADVAVTVFEETGESCTSDLRTKPGQVPQRLLAALNRDYYRPARLGDLHSVLFPEACFHWQDSASRVHQACRRLRAFLARAQIPLTIEHGRNGFYFAAKRGRAVVISKGSGTRPPRALEEKVTQLIREFGERKYPFTARDFSEHFQIETRTTQRYLRVASDLGLIHDCSRAKRNRSYLSGGTILTDNKYQSAEQPVFLKVRVGRQRTDFHRSIQCR